VGVGGLLTLKGQYHEIFRLLSFHLTTSPGPKIWPRKNVELFIIFLELYVFVIDSPGDEFTGEQI
jgi:hypothetical protein